MGFLPGQSKRLGGQLLLPATITVQAMCGGGTFWQQLDPAIRDELVERQRATALGVAVAQICHRHVMHCPPGAQQLSADPSALDEHAFRPGVSAIALAILTVAGPLRAGDPPVLVPVEGRPLPAALAATDSDGNLVFEAAGGRRVFSRRDIVCWGRCAEPERGPVLLLHDGSLLAAQLVGLKDGVMKADSDSLDLLEIPMSRLAAVVLELPAAPVEREHRLLDRALQAERAETRVVLLSGDGSPDDCWPSAAWTSNWRPESGP